MILQPKATNIIARPENAATKTKTGLLLAPGHKRTKPRLAVVVAIGEQVSRVGIGDRILFQPFAAQELTFDGDELLVLDEEFILTTVEKEVEHG
jgi:co-chaperonin GroES (HSP10)